jgi:hypothetical protein
MAALASEGDAKRTKHQGLLGVAFLIVEEIGVARPAEVNMANKVFSSTTIYQLIRIQ